MAFRVDYSRQAWQQLRRLTASQQAIITDQVDKQLTHQALIASRNRKQLRPNELAEWELRLGDLRIFYDVVMEPDPLVLIKRIGVKIGNRLLIDDEETKL